MNASNNIKIYLPNDTFLIFSFKNKLENTDNLLSLQIKKVVENKQPIIIETNLLHYKKFIQQSCVNIFAAGGVVKNEENELLMIYRLNKWDLPKGKMEMNESPKQTALREIEEETGVRHLKIIKELDSTHHIYRRDNEWHFKQTFWFEMLTTKHQKMQAQTEEGISKIEWIKKEKQPVIIKNTYPLIKEILDKYFI